MGIKVLPPDVGESIRYFAAVGEDIRFGLGAVRNVGHERRRRDRRGAPGRGVRRRSTTSSRKVPVHVANKRTVESLIKAGAFDSLGSTRRALMEIHEDATEAAVEVKRNEARRARSASTSTACTTRPKSRCRPRCPTGRSGPRRTSSRSSARCSACTSRITRSPGSRSRSPSTRRSAIHDLLASEDLQRRRPGHGRRARHERAASRRQIQRQPVRHDHRRGLRRRGHRHVHGQDLHRVPVDAEGRLDPRRARPRLAPRRRAEPARASRRSRPIWARWTQSGPLVLHDARAAGDRARRSRSSLQTLSRHEGDTEVTLKLHAVRSRRCSRCRIRCA